MRFVNRSASMRPPSALLSPEIAENRAAIAAYMDAANSLIAQQRSPFDRSLLERGGLPDDLAELFDQCCAYCETPLSPQHRAHVHLHRPSGFAAAENGQTDMLSYVWLALEWGNMLPVCENCQSAKENLFPVAARRAPTGTPIDKINDAEQALFLDPCHDAPSDHLAFRADGWAEARSECGAATIRGLNLNRPALIDARQRANLALGQALLGAHLPPTLIETLSPAPKCGLLFPPAGDDLAGHSGAATLALLDWAATQNIEAPTADRLIDYLWSLSPPARQDWCSAFINATQGEVMPLSRPTSLAPQTSEKRPSRALTLAQLPLATAPITHVTIRNFKALRDISFTLPAAVSADHVPCMLILGENATGKSSVLEALTLALLGSEEAAALDEMLDDDDIRPSEMLHRPDPDHWDVTSGEPLEISVAYHGYESLTRLNGGISDQRFQGDQGSAKIMLAYGPRRYFTKKPSRRFRAPAYRARSLFDPMATIPNPAQWLLSVDQATFDAAARALREVLMLGRSAAFLREYDEGTSGKGRVIIETDGGRTPLSEMSVGYKSVVAMATDIIREMSYYYDNLEYAAAVVLIDEIETHLHPRWKMQIITLLRRAFPRIQFIVTTHDPLCLKGMFDGEVFVLQRSATDQRVEQLRDLPNPQGMRAEQILTSEFFGLGSTDPHTDAKLLRYQTLAARAGLSAAEQNERDALQQELEGTMAIGDTMQSQIVTKAMQSAGIDTVVPLAKAPDARRKQMIADLVRGFREGDE